MTLSGGQGASAAGLLSGLLCLFLSLNPAVARAEDEPGITCDIQRGACTQKAVDGVTIAFDIQPKPVAAMSELVFSVALTRSGNPLTDASAVSLDLTMPGMFMGPNRPVMKRVSEGRYEGRGVIARCMSGRKTWQARVTFTRGGTSTVADFVFEVK